MLLTNFLALILSLHLIGPGNMPEREKAVIPVTSVAAIESFSTNYFRLLKSQSSKPDYEVFKKALRGFLDLKAENKIKKNILTIIDFSLSSSLDRMWIIDLAKMEVVHLSLVAHGQNSGLEFASRFSNNNSSHQSSLGFYLTGDIVYGGHGMSLTLDGQEPGINDNARERGIIIHGAYYVSRDFIRQYGRLGRSFGCPAIPMEDHEKIINLISGKSCVYIHYPDNKYQSSSRMLKDESAIQGMSILSNELPVVTETAAGNN
jgi:hypothetical protein